MLSFFFLYPHLYPRFVFATPPGTHDAARMRWGGNPEELNPCSSPQHRLQPAWGLHLTPLGRVAQQSEGAARITRRATLWGEPTKGGCPAIGQQAAPGPPVGRCAQGVTTGTAAGPKVAICATQNARAPAQAKTAFPSALTFFTGDTGDTL